MSYSRWSNSCWYTYWCASSIPSNKRDDQLFDVCGFRQFTYKELKADIYTCLQGVIDESKQQKQLQEAQDKLPDDEKEKSSFGMPIIYFGAWTPTWKELQELKGYMQEFIKDVEDDLLLED